jgi:replicative DNA helicase
MIETTENALPHALGPEKAVISLLLRNNLVNYTKFVELGMKFEMFYLPSHIKICSIILEYCNDGQQIEMITFIQKLMNKSMLDDLGGPAAITEIFSYAHGSSSFEMFCEEVKMKYIERELHLLSHDFQQRVVQSKEDIQSMLGDGESRMSQLQAVLHPMASGSVRTAVNGVLENFQCILSSEDPKELYGLKTGFDKMDELLMGLQNSSLYIIGARPSMGKTSFLMNMIQNICVKGGSPTLMFSLEMSQEQLIKKMIYSLAKISYHKLTARTGGKYIPSKLELVRMKDSCMSVERSPLYIDDKAAIGIDYLKTVARRYKRDFGIKMIAIDYIQLMRSNSKKAQQSRNVEVSEISNGLKEIAKELMIPVVALAQLNRDAAGNTKLTPPKMHQLRDSGSLEQDADVIGFLHRYDYEGSNDRKGEAEINIAKNREGPTDRIDLKWIPEYTQFEEKITIF